MSTVNEKELSVKNLTCDPTVVVFVANSGKCLVTLLLWAGASCLKQTQKQKIGFIFVLI